MNLLLIGFAICVGLSIIFAYVVGIVRTRADFREYFRRQAIEREWWESRRTSGFVPAVTCMACGEQWQYQEGHPAHECPERRLDS